MGLTIYNFCITRSEKELKYFHKVLVFLQYLQTDAFVQIVHLHFKHNETVKNIKYHPKKMLANVYTFEKSTNEVYQKEIRTLSDLMDLYIPRRFGTKVFVYTGHSDGMYFRKKKINILRIEDYCELVATVNNGQKAELIIFDCCLCGNINCLYTCYDFTKYVIAATSYQSYLSMMNTHSIYKTYNETESYCRSILAEIGGLEKTDHNVYKTDYSLYRLNENFVRFVWIVMMYKNYFNMKKSFVIDSVKYNDIECCFRELGINVLPLLQKFVLFNTFHKTKCKNKKLSKQKNYSIPSQLMIIHKRPSKHGMETKGDILLI
jgi:hypothetical protein